MPTAEDVSAVVVSLARSPRLGACLRALRTGCPALDVLCVVNDPDAAAQPDDVPGVRYLHPGVNLGWAAGVHWARARIERPLIWLVHDDVTVRPGVLDLLLARLDGPDGPVAVRPVPVDEHEVIPRGHCGGVLDADGRHAAWIPATATAADAFRPPEQPHYLPSSGMLLRLSAWDEVGGFNPWLHPLSFADVDLGVALRAAGHRLALEPAARMTHPTKGSTPSVLGTFAYARHELVMRASWFPHALPGPAERRALISDAILDAAVAHRHDPRPLSDDELRDIAMRSALDAVVRLARFAQRRVAAVEAERDRALADYRETMEARDWWRAQHDLVRDDLRRTEEARDWWRARHEEADRAWREASGRERA